MTEHQHVYLKKKKAFSGAHDKWVQEFAPRMAGAQTVSAGLDRAPSLGPDLLRVGIILRQAMFV